MQETPSHKSANLIFFDILDILTDDNERHAFIPEALKLMGEGFSLNNTFILEKSNNNKLELSYEWQREDCCSVQCDCIEIIIKRCLSLVKTNKDSCIQIETEHGSLLIYILKKNGKIKCVTGFRTEQSNYKWTEYESGLLRSFTKLLVYDFQRLQGKQITADPLTGMLCLTEFAHELEKRLPSMTRRYAVVYSDISGFKNINNTHGYEYGDKLIKYIARLIIWSNRIDEISCRVTADKFISLLRYDDNEGLLKILGKTSNLLKRKFLECENPECSWKSGVYIIDKDDNDAMQIIDNALAVLITAKQSDNSDVVFYDKDLELILEKNRYIMANMNKAIDNGEFQVYFQPLLDLNTNKMIGSEALVRWYKDGKIIPPCEFISIFEQNNFMSQLDFYIYEKVCQQISIWLKAKIPVCPVSVNVSRLHLKEPDFCERLLGLLEKYKLPHNYIELEITENIFINNMNDAILFIQNLKANGFMCAIDDFGSGFSSLNILRYLPVDVLKLDKEFLNDDVSVHINQQIVFHTIKLAKSLNMRVLAEGVETLDQSQYLQKCGCDMAQGYFFAHPMPVSDFTNLLKECNAV